MSKVHDFEQYEPNEMQELWLGSKKLKSLGYALLACLLLFYSFSLFSISPLEVLKQIPDKDKKDLEELFSYFLQRTTFYYTLFGDKPVSWCVISLPEFPKVKQSRKIIYKQSEKIPLWSRWKTWKLHENNFQLSNYLFIEDHHLNNPYRKDIFLINKNEFIKTVDKHRTLFQQILNCEISGDKLLKKVEQKSSLLAVLSDNDLLLGILLGFGEHNSQLYQQREDLSSVYQRYKPVLANDAVLLEKLKKKIENLTEKLQPVGDNHLMRIGTVQFVADVNSPQTRSLLDKYHTLREKICPFYLNEKYFDTTLLLLNKGVLP